MPKSVPPMNKEDRKRGRPAGKNRVPLSLEERRARNAQYERERRNETAEAMAELAEAGGYKPQISNKELLARVVNRFLLASNEKNELEEMRQINSKLEEQISVLISRLGDDVNIEELGLSDESQQDQKSTKTETIPEPEVKNPKKIRKYKQKSTVHDRVKSESQSSDSERPATERKRKGRRTGRKVIYQSESESIEPVEQSEGIPSSVERTESESSNIESVPEESGPEEMMDVKLEDIVQMDDNNVLTTLEQDSLNQDLFPLDDLTTDLETPILPDWMNSDQVDSGVMLNQEQITNWPSDFNDFLSAFG